MSVDTDAALDIGEVVARTGLAPSTLHLWERRGLITPIGRLGLRRQYATDVIDTIAVIVVCQRSGFTLEEIAELLAPETFAADKSMLIDKLAELRSRRDQLTMAIEGLEHALACPNPSPIECPGFRRHLVDVLPVSPAH